MSCSQDDEVLSVATAVETKDRDTISKKPFGTNSITYYITPFSGYTPNSSITLPGKGSCNSAVGGVIKAEMVGRVSSSEFKIRIRKQDGGTFTTGGTARVRATSVCGSIAVSSSILVGSSSIDLIIQGTFTTSGVVHFYPVIESNNSARYYAEPFMMYTLPTYKQPPYTTGEIIAEVDGVNIRASGPTNISGILAYQCTVFCKNYYNSVYGLSFSGWGNAVNWINTLDTRFEVYKYSSNPTAPRVGDILCLGTGLGHVAIITEVSSSEVKVAQQNSGPWAPVGYTLSRSGNYITPPSGYTFLGLIRKK